MRLAGKRVVNTRATEQAAALDQLLREAGAVALNYPAIAIVPPDDTEALDETLTDAQAGRYDLLVLTSSNTVESIAERGQTLGISLKGMPAAAVGEATAAAAQEQLGVELRLIPDEYHAEALAEVLTVVPGMRILLPQSEIARPTLAQRLIARGAEVTTVTAYRTVRGSGGIELAPLLRDGQVDAITFTSVSGVRYFIERLRRDGGTGFERVYAACLSARISSAARESGFVNVAEAQEQTLGALVDALMIYFAKQG